MDGRWGTNGAVLPDALAFFGCLLQCLALRVHPVDEYHPTWGRLDRRPPGPQPGLPWPRCPPYIMAHLNTSTNYFTDPFELSQHRAMCARSAGRLPNFGVMNVLLAALRPSLLRYPG